MASRSFKDQPPASAGDAEAGTADAFVAARRAARGLTDYPGTLPDGLDAAYRIQAKAIARFGQPVAGWKVGRIPDALVAHHGTNRLAGPIFAPSVIAGAAGVPEMPVFAEGFAAAEAEFLLRLGPLPERIDRAWSNEDAAALVDRICIGIEVASSPFAGINAHGPAVTVSDFGNNNGLVVGAEIAADSGFLDWPVALLIDDAVAGTGKAADMLDGPFGAVRFLLECAAQQGLPIAAGQWVSTGAVTGVHPVRPGAAVEAQFGAGLAVRCTIVAAQPE